jgi:hypothetical protein
MDQAPKELFVGVINPYALTEAITGRTFDWKDAKSYQILEETLETNYAELLTSNLILLCMPDCNLTATTL